MTDYETEIICLDCESNPCLCERTEQLGEEIWFEPSEPECGYPCMTEPDFYNCEWCGQEVGWNDNCSHYCPSPEEPEPDMDVMINDELTDNY